MKAYQLVKSLGKELVGQKVVTEPYGEYPGGIATVTEIAPDTAAPEIVFQVNLPSWGEIGVFYHEDVAVFSPEVTGTT